MGGAQPKRGPPPGTEVVIYGFSKQRQYNGRRGVIVGEKDDKLKVQLHDGPILLVGHTHVRPAPPMAPGMGLPVGQAGSALPSQPLPSQPLPSQPLSTAHSLAGGQSFAYGGPPGGVAAAAALPPAPQFALVPSAVGSRHDLDSNGIPDVLEQPMGPPPVVINWKKPPPPMYEPGSRVEAAYKDELYDKPEWFPATVVQCNHADNAYVIRWDQTGELHQCKLEDLRKVRMEKPWDPHPRHDDWDEAAHDMHFHHGAMPVPPQVPYAAGWPPRGFGPPWPGFGPPWPPQGYPVVTTRSVGVYA